MMPEVIPAASPYLSRPDVSLLDLRYVQDQYRAVGRARWGAALVLVLVAIWVPRLSVDSAGSVTGIRIDNPVPATNGHFGFTVAGLGDIDGDATADVAVGAPTQGRVFLISGSSHDLLHSISDPDNLDGTQCEPTIDEPSPCDFGLAVAGAGDVNNDGVDDVAVGAPGIFGAAVANPCMDPSQPCPQDGRAFIFSGKTGALILRLAHDGPNQGAAIVKLGSIDGDGIPDLAVVAPGQTSKGGLVAAFAGSDGHELWTTFAPPASEGIKGLAFTNSTLAVIPDVNGDGKRDLVVGAPCYSIGQELCVGRALVLSGATGAQLRIHDNPSPLGSDEFGVGVAGIGDQNSDGIADYAISEPGSALSAGSLIHVYSGASGTPLSAPLVSPADERNAPDSNRLTMALAGVDDKNGDGLPDFWLGAAKTGAAYLLNDQGLELETAADSELETNFGIALSALAAPSGQPGLDIVLGAHTRSVGVVQAAGAVFLLRAEADLQVTKTATPSTVAPGGTMTYSVTVFNAGPSVAFKVKLSDPIQAPLELVPASLSDDPACTFTVATDELECAIDALAPGASFKVEFDATVPDDVSVPSTVGNTATVAAFTTDPVPANNTATTSTPLTCDIVGTPGNDVLVGTAAGETICGAGGDDVLIGLGGSDVLIGGVGDDILIGGAGDDTLLGGPGNDRLLGEIGNDNLFGDAGDDQLLGGGGTDQLDGGPGDDFCKAQSGVGTITNCEKG